MKHSDLGYAAEQSNPFSFYQKVSFFIFSIHFETLPACTTSNFVQTDDKKIKKKKR